MTSPIRAWVEFNAGKKISRGPLRLLKRRQFSCDVLKNLEDAGLSVRRPSLVNLMWKICPCALTGWKTRAPHPDKPNCHGSPTRGHIRYSQVRSSGCWSSKEFSKLLVTREKSFPIHGEYLTRSLGRLFHPCRFANNCYLRIFIEHELNDRGILFLIPRAFASA